MSLAADKAGGRLPGFGPDQTNADAFSQLRPAGSSHSRHCDGPSSCSRFRWTQSASWGCMNIGACPSDDDRHAIVLQIDHHVLVLRSHCCGAFGCGAEPRQLPPPPPLPPQAEPSPPPQRETPRPAAVPRKPSLASGGFHPCDNVDGDSAPETRGSFPCPFPPAANLWQIDSATVVLEVQIDPSGYPQQVRVEQDPGYGFGDVALGCACRHRYTEPAFTERVDASGRIHIKLVFRRDGPT